MALPTLVIILLVGIWLQSAVSLRARCQDAARAGARAASRGDAAAVIRARLMAALPGSSVDIVRRGESVTVTIRARSSPLPGFEELGAQVSASAVASVETVDAQWLG